MQREQRRQYRADPEPKREVRPMVLARLKGTQMRLRCGRPKKEATEIPRHVWNFVQRIFPMMSREGVLKNMLEIRNCMDDQALQRRTGSPYRTIMRLTEDQTIELAIRRKGPSSDILPPS